MNPLFDESVDGFQAVRFDGRRLHLIDQRRLPASETWLSIADVDGVIQAIADLVVRGAPAIGITAAYGAVIAARVRGSDLAGWMDDLARLAAARPTAVNLVWAVERMRKFALEQGELDADALAGEAQRIHRADIEANRAMAQAGSAQIEPGSGVLTHCNTGSLATGGIGTALGVIVAGARSGRIARIYADETRPWLQGSRLTAWELARAGLDFRVIVEGAAAALMASGAVQWVITGADRIAANGDVANKIGTYTVAVLAREHNLPFYVAAPTSTVDPNIPHGGLIPIEERDPREVTHCGSVAVAPDGIAVRNPAFDVTPARLVSAIITERGVARGDYTTALAAMLKKES